MDGRTLKFLNVLDEYSRVCLAIRVGRRCKAVEVIDTIEELLKLYPAPTHLRMDNGPEFIANALQEWCAGSGCSTAYIPPGSPCARCQLHRRPLCINHLLPVLIDAKQLEQQQGRHLCWQSPRPVR